MFLLLKQLIYLIKNKNKGNKNVTSISSFSCTKYLSFCKKNAT